VSGDVTHRISAEGADLLALAGVNDGNLQELEQATGVRVTLRGERITLAGELEAVERATRIAAAMVDLARMGETVSPEDVQRLAANGGRDAAQLANGNYKIALPGMRRVVQPKSAGQQTYVEAMRENDIVPERERPTSPLRWGSRPSAGSECGAWFWRGRPWRPAKGSASCPATFRRRSIHTCGRCTTRSKT
jgi:hypothetical protein